MNQRFVNRFEDALQTIHEGLSKPRITKRINKLWEHIGRLKEKSHGVRQYYNITLVPDEKNINAVALTWKQRSHPKGRLANPGV